MYSRANDSTSFLLNRSIRCSFYSYVHIWLSNPPLTVAFHGPMEHDGKDQGLKWVFDDRLCISVGSYTCARMWKLRFAADSTSLLQLDCWSATRTWIINLPTNQKGYDTFEATVGKLSARRIRFCPVYFCLGIILKVIQYNFQNDA